MADSQNSKADVIPEPPKFNLEDLPAPPKLEVPKEKQPLPQVKLKEINIPAPDDQSVEASDTTTPKKDVFPMAPSWDSKAKPIPMDLSLGNKKSDFPSPPAFDIKDKARPADQKLPDLSKIDFPSPSDMKKEGSSKKDAAEDKQKKGGLFGLFGSKKKENKIVEPPKLDMHELGSIKLDMPEMPKMPEFTKKEEPKTDLKIPEPIAVPVIASVSVNDQLAKEMPVAEPDPEWVREGEDYIDEALSKGSTQDVLRSVEENTPLINVKGVGPKRERMLRRAGIKSAEHLAIHTHKAVAKKIGLPDYQAKEIVTNAQKITKIKQKLKNLAPAKDASISDVIKKLEQEKKEVERISRQAPSEEALIKLDGHKEIVNVLEKLEKKRSELIDMQKRVAEKEQKLQTGNSTYKRDLDYIDNLKRRLDHDVRERTQYLMNLEKEYFQRAQVLAKKQSDVEIKEKQATEKEKYAKDSEIDIKKRLSDLQDKELTLNTREKKLSRMMLDVEKQDELMKGKEDDLIKREEEYLRKLDILEKHEKSILRNLEERRLSLSKKEKEIESRETRLHQQQRNVDKKGVAVEMQKAVVETQKSKLIDDEFEQYLKDQLSKVNSSGITKGDIDVLSNLRSPSETSPGNPVQIIETCRNMVRTGRVSEAKVYYNQLRDKYYSMSFTDSRDKENIHNAIRSLYDEINIADMAK